MLEIFISSVVDILHLRTLFLVQRRKQIILNKCSHCIARWCYSGKGHEGGVERQSEFSAGSSLRVRPCRAPRTRSPSPRSHCKSKVLKSLTAEGARIKKQFQNQPSDAICIEVLLSEGKPRIIVHLPKIEIILINTVHTLVLVLGQSGKEGKALAAISTQATWLYLQLKNAWARELCPTAGHLSSSLGLLVSRGTRSRCFIQ